MSDARTSGRASHPRWRAPGRGLPPGFGVLWTTVAIDLLGFGIVIPLLPLYARHLGAGPASVGLLLAAFSGAAVRRRTHPRDGCRTGWAASPC